jgi:tripartite-type tricarboxylate transporter receptor subunit TctC
MSAIARLQHVLLLLVFSLLTFTSPAAADDDFYRGKTVTVVVGFSPGGTYDLYARVLSRHIGKFIPGKPNSIVQNMPGAGSLTALRYLDANAPKDGTVFVTFNSSLIMQSILEPQTVKLKFTDMAWIGTGSQQFRVCYAWYATGLKTWDDVVKAKEFIVGATAAGTSNYVNGVILQKMFGVKVRQILGYPGKNEQIIATERGELQGGCAEWSGVPEHWLAEKKINPFVTWLPKPPADFGYDVPYIGDLTKTADDKAVLEMINAASLLGNPFVASRQVPAERIKTLRAAFSATVANAAFIAEVESLRMQVDAKSGEQAAKLAADIYKAATPDLVAKAKDVLK